MTWIPGRISLLVPSRDRPDRLAEMWRSAESTAARPDDLELVVRLDDDEPKMSRYAEWQECNKTQVTIIVGPRILLSQTWNVCLAVASGEILMHGNDDVLFRTPRWDEDLREAFARYPDGIVLVHGRDGIHDGGMATLGFYHRRWVETLGYLCPPHFSSDYNDTWNSTVADMVGRRVFLPQVLTEHMHPAVGKGPLDRTHQERLSRHSQDGVDALYASLVNLRHADAEKLRAAMTS